jgi:NAD(P)-dependent dehydrogenase (short-subunit alcohol dehydrogenase family)
MDLRDKTVIVTGAASGIGRETAHLLRERGAAVIGVDRHRASEVERFLACDLADPAAIVDLVNALPAGANGLCNIAGVAPSRPPGEVLRVNLLGLRLLTEGLVPKLADGASIVNLASMAGNRWRDNLGQVREVLAVDWDTLDDFVRRYPLAEGGRSYFLSKEAVVVWTMLNRWTWRERGIRMNCVSPGPIETPILPDFLETLGERAQESVRNMDRFGRPADVAPTIAFLLSDEADWYRGANLTPDGGMGSHLALKPFGLAE